MTTEELKNDLGGMIWKAANDLGRNMPKAAFKNYILGSLFYRFISENFSNYVDANSKSCRDAGGYANMLDSQAAKIEETMVRQKGFFIAPSQLFCNVAQQAATDLNLNLTLINAFNAIEGSTKGHTSEEDFKGLFANFDPNNSLIGNSVEERCRFLTKMLECVAGFNFTHYADSGLDVFGICYEHLIKMYALNSGTKGGEFYTPAEVSRLLALIAVANRTTVDRVYDPACGSGSLLLNFKTVLGDNKVSGYYGQEVNPETFNLCRMNMILHNIGYNKFDIRLGDTLLEPQHLQESYFDAIVSNPPYSTQWKVDENPTLGIDPRFAPAGVLAPSSKADLAFVMHILYSLKPEGTAAIVEFPGVLYRGGKEQQIRRYLVESNVIDTVIALPPNLFFGTSISTSIIVVKKNRPADAKITFIDATGDFVHEGNKNKLSEENISRIYAAHLSRAEEAHYSHSVSCEEVAAQDYNLTVSTYVAPKENREEIDIMALNSEIAAVVARQSSIRSELDAIISEIEQH